MRGPPRRSKVLRMRAPLVLAAALLVAGCAASPFPEALTRSVDRSLSLTQIRADPQAHRGYLPTLTEENVAGSM